jgi:hypothetical protein
MLIIAVELYHIHNSPLIRLHTTTETSGSGAHHYGVKILQRAGECQRINRKKAQKAQEAQKSFKKKLFVPLVPFVAL